MNHIEYPDRYEAAIKANIISNAQKTFSRNVEDADAIIAWCAENAERNNFAASLYGAYWDYGKLTEKQCAIVRERIKGNTKRQAEWEAKQAAEAALAEPVPSGRHTIKGVVLSTAKRGAVSVTTSVNGAPRFLSKRTGGSSCGAQPLATSAHSKPHRRKTEYARVTQ